MRCGGSGVAEAFAGGCDGAAVGFDRIPRHFTALSGFDDILTCDELGLRFGGVGLYFDFFWDGRGRLLLGYFGFNESSVGATGKGCED